MIGFEEVPANTLPTPEVKRSSAAPPRVAALILMLPPAPMRVFPVAPAGISVPLENSSSTPPLIAVPPDQELPTFVSPQFPPVTARKLLPLITPLRGVSPPPPP